MPTFPRAGASLLCLGMLLGLCAEGWTQNAPRRPGRRPAPPAADPPATSGAAAPALADDPVINQARMLSGEDITTAMDKGTDALLLELNQEIADFKKAEAAAGGNPRRRRRADTDDYLAGSICLAVDALLTVGRITGDPRLHFTSKEMAPAIDCLLSMHTEFTYSLALQASALSLLPNRPDLRKPLTDARNDLLAGAVNAIYTYHTYDKSPEADRDNSNTQYGQLGVWACRDAGLEVPAVFWESANTHWRNTQLPSGGWVYSRYGASATTTMTAAGVASLFLIQDQLDHAVSFNPKPDKVLDAGIQYLAANFPTYRSDLGTDLYLAYGIERVGLAGGLKTLGTHDWYREGAALIVEAQNHDGSWDYSAYNAPAACGTAYALLFLARGIAPVACAKLQYAGPWNARGRDCARFVHWLSQQTEKTLNWQTVSIDSDPAEWSRIPILVITGHEDPKFTPEQIAHLRAYVQNGGLIFSSADEASAAFTKAIREKVAPAVCDNLYEMRALPDDHPLFQLDYKEPAKGRPHLFGLSNGVREVWIHSADDITAAWQANSTAKSQNFEIPANIYFYATGRTPLPIRFDALKPPDPPPAAVTLNIARLIYSGNWNPEPAAWDRFAAEVRQSRAAVIHATPTKIADLDPTKTPIAAITGTAAFAFTAEEKQKLADFIAKGGTLLADSAGGNRAFADSFKSEIAAIFPDSPLTLVTAQSPLLAGAALPGGAPIKSLETRRYTDFPENRDRPIYFTEAKKNGKPVILFSHGDLTAGIAGISAWGILGYTPATTSALAWNALMYLDPPPAQPVTAPATAPATLPAPPQ